jgi:aspartate/methionine/tyrosine aminotransferase
MRLSTITQEQIDSPIATAYALLPHRRGARPLLDLAQAAPQYPPAPAVVEHIVRVAHTDRGGTYVETAGLPVLREALAGELTRDYDGVVRPDQVLITAGCNQAFCLAIAAVAAPGDQVILVLPFYFNHDMWLRLNGIAPVYLDPGPDPMPTAAGAASLITERTRAIVLVTPGNPSGVTVSPAAIAEFAALAGRHDIALIIDETYRIFRGNDEPAHSLFATPDWPDTVIALHSFSKEFAIPGYRVGALVAGDRVVREAAKPLDCVAVCAPRVGQEAAWAGLTMARDWRRERAAEVAERQRWFAAAMAARPGGYELVTAGGFFGWIRHPHLDRGTDDVTRSLAIDLDTLVIPGTAFLPEDRSMIRVSVANADQCAIEDFARRLAI